MAASRTLATQIIALLLLPACSGPIECPAGLFASGVACVCPEGKETAPDSQGNGFSCRDPESDGSTTRDPRGETPTTTIPADASAAPEIDGGATMRPLCTETSPERCDSRDNDCDGRADEGLADLCGPCRPIDEVCDGKDNDCDQLVDEALLNRCGSCGELPEEFCDSKDNDCDGRVDEDVQSAPSWYLDCDFDGWAPASAGVKSCLRPRNRDGCDWTQMAPMNGTTDCNDEVREIHPGANYGFPPEPVIAKGPPEKERYFRDLDCDGVEEPSVSALAIWDDTPIDKFLTPLPFCGSGSSMSCPCLQKELDFSPEAAGGPLVCWYGFTADVRELARDGSCAPSQPRLVLSLCR